MTSTNKIHPIVVLIDYTNHAGIRSIRQIAPIVGTLRFESNQWHHEPQWLFDAYDQNKDDVRTFALADIHSWDQANMARGRAALSFAKQLQHSIEYRSRMVTRLEKLKALCADDSEWEALVIPLGFILRDEEPAWPRA